MNTHEAMNRLRGVIGNLRAAVPPETRALTPEEVDACMGELPLLPGNGAIVQAADRRRARFALDKVRPEDLAEFLADYLRGRLDPMRAVLTLQAAADIAEEKRK